MSLFAVKEHNIKCEDHLFNLLEQVYFVGPLAEQFCEGVLAHCIRKNIFDEWNYSVEK